MGPSHVLDPTNKSVFSFFLSSAALFLLLLSVLFCSLSPPSISSFFNSISLYFMGSFCFLMQSLWHQKVSIFLTWVSFLFSVFHSLNHFFFFFVFEVVGLCLMCIWSVTVIEFGLKNLWSGVFVWCCLCWRICCGCIIFWFLWLEMLGSNTNLVTTVIGFGMSATFIVFVCTRIICGRLRGGVESRMMYEIESRFDIEQVILFSTPFLSSSSSSVLFLLVNMVWFWALCSVYFLWIFYQYYYNLSFIWSWLLDYYCFDLIFEV